MVAKTRHTNAGKNKSMQTKIDNARRQQTRLTRINTKVDKKEYKVDKG